ncbi:hypothetical protein AEQ67_19035 [Pseudomonas sp. RIT-PI-q]|uniref:hypothetical protein n=1 Tax=Pseudomonas sp. RIT-PI-q TaxID=1690247 RepID=UPI0006CD813F|nr:hypothetical protein [Pseudomonas sp. RIT-PI-q]KPG96022.1 hypothetical protein AEQ67_19035 [Pseudomonas sp. RIT-PI-q]
MKTLKKSWVPLPSLACWPQRSIERDDVWNIFELQLKRDGLLDWFLRESIEFGPIVYRNLDDALNECRSTNAQLIGIVDTLALSAAERLSLRLKVEKAITSEERLMKEERWMQAEAMRRHASAPRPKAEDLILAADLEALREPLFDILKRYPYVRRARISRYGITLKRAGDNDWTVRDAHTQKTAIHCSREKTSRGFELDGSEHWGRTKAAIRAALLPRANQLLQETGFKMMLDDALRRGQRIVVCGGFVFWYEEGNTVGWTVKQLAQSGSGKEGYTLWEKGTIVSTNHGRIVVLPYIKESGELVKGHTKNAPHDGKAKLRHPNHYVDLPFETLEGDLMYDLFGRIQYE